MSTDVRNFAQLKLTSHTMRREFTAFKEATMDKAVISQIRLTKKYVYRFVLFKTFEKCKADHCSSELGESLLGCCVHWNCSWQWICDRVSCSKDKNLFCS